MRHCVYVAKIEGKGVRPNLVKIGYSIGVKGRLASIQGTIRDTSLLVGIKCEPKPKLLGVLKFRTKVEAKLAERDLHSHYSDNRVVGEYFTLDGRRARALQGTTRIKKVLFDAREKAKLDGPKSLQDFIRLGLVTAKAMVYSNWPGGNALAAFKRDVSKVGKVRAEHYCLNGTPRSGNSPVCPWTGWVIVRPKLGKIPEDLKQELRLASEKKGRVSRLRKVQKGGVKIFSNKVLLYAISLGAWNRTGKDS